MNNRDNNRNATAQTAITPQVHEGGKNMAAKLRARAWDIVPEKGREIKGMKADRNKILRVYHQQAQPSSPPPSSFSSQLACPSHHEVTSYPHPGPGVPKAMASSNPSPYLSPSDSPSNPKFYHPYRLYPPHFPRDMMDKGGGVRRVGPINPYWTPGPYPL